MRLERTAYLQFTGFDRHLAAEHETLQLRGELRGIGIVQHQRDGFGIGPEQREQRDHAPLRHQPARSEEHTSELQSLMRISYAVFCLTKKKQITTTCYTIQCTRPI